MNERSTKCRDKHPFRCSDLYTTSRTQQGTVGPCPPSDCDAAVGCTTASPLSSTPTAADRLLSVATASGLPLFLPPPPQSNRRDISGASFPPPRRVFISGRAVAALLLRLARDGGRATARVPWPSSDRSDVRMECGGEARVESGRKRKTDRKEGEGGDAAEKATRHSIVGRGAMHVPPPPFTPPRLFVRSKTAALMRVWLLPRLRARGGGHGRVVRRG